MSKYYRVYADIRLDIIRDNVDRLMALTPSGTKSIGCGESRRMDMVILQLLRLSMIKYMAMQLQTLDEAVNLRENGIDKPILILLVLSIQMNIQRL